MIAALLASVLLTSPSASLNESPKQGSPSVKPSKTGKIPDAAAKISAAKRQAAKEGKNILVHFGASWCPWCRRFDELLGSPRLKAAWDRSYVPVEITVRESPKFAFRENKGWEPMMRGWRGTDEKDIPYIVILDAQGKKLADSVKLVEDEIPSNAGYPQTPSEIDAFLGMIERTGRFTAEERATLRATVTPK